MREVLRRTSKRLKSIKPKDLLRAVTKIMGKGEIQEAHEGNGLLFLPMYRDAIPQYSEIGPFQDILILKTARPFPVGDSSREPFLNALVCLGSNRARMSVETVGSVSPSAKGDDLVLTQGWGTLVRSGGPFAVPTTAPVCGVQIGKDSPAAEDLVYRRDLFERIATAMGCSEIVRFDLVDGALMTSVADSWQVTFARAELGGRNARGFFLYGFNDINAAVEAGERVLKSAFRRVDENSFFAFTSEEADYETLRAPLNTLIQGWEVEVLGHLTKAAAMVLAGGLPEDELSPNRLPVFKYRSHSNQIFGELVAVDGGYALELSSLDATPEQLEACIEAVEGRASKKSRK